MLKIKLRAQPPVSFLSGSLQVPIINTQVSFYQLMGRECKPLRQRHIGKMITPEDLKKP